MAAVKFILAVTSGNLEGVQILLNNDKNNDLVNYCAEDGNTPLIYACAHGRESIVRFLLSKGANLTSETSTNVYGWSPLMVASYYGHLKIVNLLLQQSADCDVVSHCNRLFAMALHCAARCNRIQIAELLISKGALVNIPSDKMDKRCHRSPLMAAVQHGHDQMASLLLSHGAAVDYGDPYTGWTPLMLAAANGHKTAVKILLERGADCNLVNNLGQTALAIAKRMRRKDIENELRPCTSRREQNPESLLVKSVDIVLAAKAGDLQQIQSMSLQNDFDVNESREDGRTPLMWASIGNHFRIALFLVKNGADVNLQDSHHGWTALMYAIHNNNKSIVGLLVLNGANIQLESHDKKIPFDQATVVGDCEVIRILGAAYNLNGENEEKAKRNASWNYLLKTLQKNLFEDNINLLVRCNTTTKELQFLDLCENGKQGFKTSLTKKFSKLQYNFNRTMHLLNKRQPVKPQTLRPPSHEALHPINGNLTGNSISLTRGSNATTEVSESTTTTIDLTDPLKTTFLPLAGPSVNEWIGDIVAPIVPPFTPSTTRDFNTKQRELMDALLSTSPQDDLDEYPYGSKHKKDKIHPGTNGRVHSRTPKPPDLPNPKMWLTNGTNLAHSRFKIDALSYTPRISPSHGNASTSQKPFSLSPTPPCKPPSKRKANSLPRIGRTSVISTSQGSFSKTMFDSGYPEMMKDLLERLSLQQYTAILEEQQVDVKTFLTLNVSDLNEIGIKKQEEQEQILAAVQLLKGQLMEGGSNALKTEASVS
ncbi:ankyrin repeat and SAM domain-containing protein 6-like [Xenia sp. Carnegie-2017]|uniref:ankyrin repeat and SAM domain-containing protein 6-like n=1 Tax=Xenia sp. Carnegie-2017 TaxID=2897299 RepID=UPI001F04C4DC|nr:ankyrin repeat and SAM domain-containing protein 6-like [Xenia sp. Carnegie-2017]